MDARGHRARGAVLRPGYGAIGALRSGLRTAGRRLVGKTSARWAVGGDALTRRGVSLSAAVLAEPAGLDALPADLLPVFEAPIFADRRLAARGRGRGRGRAPRGDALARRGVSLSAAVLAEPAGLDALPADLLPVFEAPISADRRLAARGRGRGRRRAPRRRYGGLRSL